jgi:hypothetical protein
MKLETSKTEPFSHGIQYPLSEVYELLDGILLAQEEPNEDGNWSGVYAITNTLTDEIYFGRSSQINNRLRFHEVRSRSSEFGQLIHQDIAKVGIEYFTFEIVELLELAFIRKELEEDLIRQFGGRYNQGNKGLQHYVAIPLVEGKEYKPNTFEYNGITYANRREAEVDLNFSKSKLSRIKKQQRRIINSPILKIAQG